MEWLQVATGVVTAAVVVVTFILSQRSAIAARLETSISLQTSVDALTRRLSDLAKRLDDGSERSSKAMSNIQHRIGMIETTLATVQAQLDERVTRLEAVEAAVLKLIRKD